ncbi:M48 family metallopeptidase [Psychroserpens sp.]|uniref:M48 family metallopeptidase n=1 Tax=Psychroserpens sp. TaxID=2020870 RepID=UPI001B1EE74B|nr:M48 family metallopeptidase [Psychroserpens sp.]MBO6606311.1 M48 family metallopeptidase [Psychroserpens sp.]MBO6653015.1 M48 family metallopeptidase [Psychroserpens sp.]MBO6680958.1 M48 family metallopeptidase [Psychroserpens sp.]MBO6750086.1 M48 family metallopeptidase [Psychroserpens sp.]MBO6914566.1 M48 family metallopeptidase [Psychroserpens sp.]
MNATQLYYLIIAIIIIDFVIDKVLNALNAKHYNDPIPDELNDVYDEEDYKRSQDYKLTNYRFGIWSSLFSVTLTLGFLFFDGFEFVDNIARSFSKNPMVIGLIFFGIIMLASDILTTPFSYYKTFVIEERFGFNKTTKATFLLDKLKGLLMMAILGGLILGAIIWFYKQTQELFWLYAWGIVTGFTIIMNMFYSRLIVPMFNKQTPLEEGSLRDKISEYAQSVGFSLKKIFVIDGSKRSTKANAYFSGFGSEKRVTLYDTLINDLDEEEIVAVLAHEVGHYKRKHIIFNLFASIALTGLTFFILSIFISNPILSNAIGVETPSFHVGLIAFGLLYAPISEVTGLLMNFISRQFEYQADDYAKQTYAADPLITSLKKLNKTSLSNLTPHKSYVFVHYSHPTLLERVMNLKKQ